MVNRGLAIYGNIIIAYRNGAAVRIRDVGDAIDSVQNARVGAWFNNKAAEGVAIVDAQRRELLRRLRDAQRIAMAEPRESDAALLLEGIVLRLQADLRWLEACERTWTRRKASPRGEQ